MSERKKVIHVKDLVIKAENVYVERPRHQHRPHPFFGPRREFNSERREEGFYESSESEDVDDEDKQGPFSWL